MLQIFRNILHIYFYSVINYYFRRKVVSLSGDLILGGLFPMHEQVIILDQTTSPQVDSFQCTSRQLDQILDNQPLGLLIIFTRYELRLGLNRFLQLWNQSSFCLSNLLFYIKIQGIKDRNIQINQFLYVYLKHLISFERYDKCVFKPLFTYFVFF